MMDTRQPQRRQWALLLALVAAAASMRPAVAAAAAAGTTAAADGYSALCVVGKNENLNVREWVEYHKCLGEPQLPCMQGGCPLHWLQQYRTPSTLHDVCQHAIRWRSLLTSLSNADAVQCARPRARPPPPNLPRSKD